MENFGYISTFLSLQKAEGTVLFFHYSRLSPSGKSNVYAVKQPEGRDSEGETADSRMNRPINITAQLT